LSSALSPLTNISAEGAQQAAPTIDVVASGLDTPWALAFAPDGRLFVTERAGRIRIVKDGALQPDPWITLQVAEVSEAGLLGLAIDPNFAQNRFVYVA
jgi:glucose/arabinose dehydrogenase